MRSFIANSEVFVLSLWSLLVLIRVLTLRRNSSRDIVNARGVKSNQSLYIWLKDLVPKFLMFSKEVSLRTFHKLNLSSFKVSNIKTLIFSERLSLSLFNQLNLY